MKSFLTILILGVLTADSRAQLIDTPKPATPPAAELAAQSIIDSINAEITRRVAVQKIAWETLWENQREGATPTAVLEKMGAKAALVFAFSAENLAHIQKCAQLVGKNATDFIEAKYLSTPQPITIHADGTVTLSPP